MDLSLTYSKTSKGAKAVLARSRALPSSCMQVLSSIDGKTSASTIQAKLQLSEEKFSQALTQLLNEAYIQVVQDFGPSIFDLNSAIQVAEISPEEFLNLGLPEDDTAQTQDQLEAEARAKAYAEEQARKAAQAREQEEAERKLLLVTDILAKSGDKIDIEKLASETPAKVQQSKRQQAGATPAPEAQKLSEKDAPDLAPAQPEAPPSSITESLDLTQPLELQGIGASVQNEVSTAASTQAEGNARRLAEEKVRQEQLRAREDAERRAREKAEAEAKARQEVEARAEAERRKHREAEEKAKLKAEEKARREEEHRARKEAERARKLAEQQAREEARARAKEEAERKAREEAERRKKEKAEAEERARVEAEQRAKERAARLAREAAEAEARAEAAHKAKEAAAARKQALALQKEEARQEARRLAQEKAELRAEQWARQKAELEIMASGWLHGALTYGRPLIFGLVAAAVVLLLLLQFINLSMLAPSIEKRASAGIGEPVKIMKVRFAVWPKPHLILEGLSVGEMSDIKARSSEIYLTASSYVSDTKVLNSLEIEGLEIAPESLGRPIRWLRAGAQQGRLQVENIALKNVQVKLPVDEFPVFDADLRLTPAGNLEIARLSAKHITAELSPVKEGLQVSIEAQAWEPPLGPAVTFDELAAKGIADAEKLVLKKVEGSLYGGTINAIATIAWKNSWRTEGNFELANVHLDQAASALSDAARMQGSLNARADFSGSAETIDQLFDHAVITARFEAQHGEIAGLDLARAASGRQQVGGTTRYDSLNGNWLMNEGHYRLTQLGLKAGSLQAQGDLEISPEQEVSGKVQTLLSLNSRQLQGKFTLSGKLGNVRISH